MTKSKSDQHRESSFPVRANPSLFPEFDDSSQATIIGGLLDVQKRLSIIKPYVTFQINKSPESFHSDIETLVTDIKVLVDRLKNSIIIHNQASNSLKNENHV